MMISSTSQDTYAPPATMQMSTQLSAAGVTAYQWVTAVFGFILTGVGITALYKCGMKLRVKHKEILDIIIIILAIMIISSTSHIDSYAPPPPPSFPALPATMQMSKQPPVAVVSKLKFMDFTITGSTNHRDSSK
ncbi:hypothetical protein Tco_0271793 [Tanacetum coccineum]